MSRADGFTLIEVTVAAALLLVGVLAAVSLLDVANGTTADAKARTGANNLARRTIEAARTITLANLDQANGASLVQARAGDLADASGEPGWTVVREGVTYTIAWGSCLLDDPGDGTSGSSARTAEYCDQPAASTPPDPAPADARRVTVTVSWTGRGREKRVRSVAVLPLGVGDLPIVESVTLVSPFACAGACTIESDTARLRALTNADASSMTWLVDGSVAAACPPGGACSGSGKTWFFDWALGTPVRDTAAPNAGKCMPGSYRPDGSFEVGARAADAFGRARNPVSQTIILNRCAPWPVSGFTATGRDSLIPSTHVIDVEWSPPADGDVIGYRVYKGASPTSLALMTCAGAASSTLGVNQRTCVDPADSRPSYSTTPFYYAVAALDRAPDGTVREGWIASKNVNTGNRAPGQIAANGTAIWEAARVGGTVSLKWTKTEDPDGGGDQVTAYRIYRRTATGAVTYLDRIAKESAFASCGDTATCGYVDTAPPASATYYVTAVDTHGRESLLSAGRTA